MSDFAYYDEIDSQLLRRRLQLFESHMEQTSETPQVEPNPCIVDPSSTAFIDGSMVEALMRRTR